MKGAVKPIVENRKAGFDYFIESKLEAGMELKGSEVKSCREGKVQLVDAYASIEGGELWLYKAHISEYKQGGPYFNHEPVRKRKLLIHRRELIRLRDAIERQGYTLIPTRMYFKGGVAKVEIGVARGKTKGDKRHTAKLAEGVREVARARRRGNSSDAYDD